MMTLEETIAWLEDQCANGGHLYSEDDVQAARRFGNDYIFRYSRKAGGMCMCSACGNDVDIGGVAHGNIIKCPSCGKIVMIKDEWRGHSILYDSLVLYSWRRCGAEGLIVVGMDCERDFNLERPEQACVGINERAIWQIEPGRAQKYERCYYSGRWAANKEGVQPLAYNRRSTWHTGMRKAMEGTRIGRIYEALENATSVTLEAIPATCAIARKGYIEYLCAQGQRDLAAEIAMSKARNIVLSPRARSVDRLLGLTEGQWYEVRRDGIRLRASTLQTLRSVQHAGGMTIGVRRAEDICERLGMWSLDRLEKRADDVLEGVPAKLRRKAVRRATDGNSRDIHEWLDYWGQLKTLGEDRTDGRLLIPRDLHTMHQRMTDRIEALRIEEQRKVDALKRMEFDKRLGKLRRKYCFCAEGLVLRPFESAEEVIAEGKALHICIGGYAKRYIEGDTILCCLRKEDAPEVPWRAVEFSAYSGAVVQDRGAYNDRNEGAHNFDNGIAELLSRFWAQFDAEKATNRRKTA